MVGTDLKVENMDILKQPVFIGGAGRSGTTLLRVILNAHNKFASGPEFKMIPEIIKTYTNLNKMESLMHAYKLNAYDLNIIFRNHISNLLLPFLRSTNAERIIEKTPHNIYYFHELSLMFPDAKFIHVVRDGRDVAASLLTMDWYDLTGKKVWYVQNVKNASRYWKSAVNIGLAYEKNLMVKDKLYTVKYENIINKPKKTLKEVMAFLGEDWDENILEYYKVERGYEPVESSTKQVNKQLNTRSLHRWKKSFSEKDIRDFKVEAGDILVSLGYEEDDAW